MASRGGRNSQTGVPGVPAEPFVVSFEIVGTHDSDGPDLRVPARELRSSIEALKAHHRSEGWLGWDTWALGRCTPDNRQRSWVYQDGVVDESRWDEAVEGVPERYDTVDLSSRPWGNLQLKVPSRKLGTRPTRTLSAWIESPTAGVDEAAEAMLDRLVAGAAVPGVVTGFVHVDSIGDPYSTVVTDGSRLSVDRFEVEVPGYYWAVLLTEGHLERLGGLANVRREAPCAHVEVLDLGTRRGVLCQLTDSPLEMDADRVVAWRDFLLPVLPAGYPTGWEEIGQHGTDLKRPLWLFEGDPAPRLTRFPLMHARGEGPQVAVEWSSFVSDPESPTCWLYPGPSFDRERHPGVVNAVVNAWFLTGVHGRLFEVEGVLHHSSGATWDTDDDDVEALAWQVDFGSCDVEAAVDRLAAALGELEDVLGGGPIFDRLKIG